MKIILNERPISTIDEFADKHGLVMEVNERGQQYWRSNGRYYAQFKNSDVAGIGLLVGTYGNGHTPDDAIADYAKEISGKILIINSRTPDMKKILVPMLIKENNG